MQQPRKLAEELSRVLPTVLAERRQRIGMLGYCPHLFASNNAIVARCSAIQCARYQRRHSASAANGAALVSRSSQLGLKTTSTIGVTASRLPTLYFFLLSHHLISTSCCFGA